MSIYDYVAISGQLRVSSTRCGHCQTFRQQFYLLVNWKFSE